MQTLFNNPNFWTGAIKAREEIIKQNPTDVDPSIAAGLERLYIIEATLRKGRYRFNEIKAFTDWYNSGTFLSSDK
jgi:hypothetical protein